MKSATAKPLARARKIPRSDWLGAERPHSHASVRSCLLVVGGRVTDESRKLTLQTAKGVTLERHRTTNPPYYSAFLPYLYGKRHIDADRWTVIHVRVSLMATVLSRLWERWVSSKAGATAVISWQRRPHPGPSYSVLS